MNPAFHLFGKQEVIKRKDGGEIQHLKAKTHYTLHLVTFCLVVMEAARMGSEALVGTANENLLSHISILHPLSCQSFCSAYDQKSLLASYRIVTFKQCDYRLFVLTHVSLMRSPLSQLELAF